LVRLNFGRIAMRCKRNIKSSKDQRFEWYARFVDIKEHIDEYLKPHYNALDIGCGTSSKEL
jgi:hypothetical protein